MDWTTGGLSAAVLTGGQSRRMGTDKALLTLGDRTMLERVLAVVSALSDDVFLVGDRPAYRTLGVRVVADDHPGAGPLGAIATALRRARYDRVLVVACDMPCLSPEVLQAMAAVDADADAIVPVTPAARSDQGGSQTYETLHAMYRRSCLPAIERRITAGDLKIAGLLDDVRVMVLDEHWLRQHDPDLRSFENVNTPEDIARHRDEG